ncbi:MAG: hypothetical protein C0625_09100 [Arcobacter sp.]|nr:MAG: hypothetical protein C0625_09100 [Arcobacter sp.]
MKFFKYILIVLVLNLSLQANLDDGFYFGVSIYKFDKSSQSRTKRSVLKIMEEWEKLFDKKIKIIFIENEENLLKDFKKFEKMNAIITFTTFYLKNKEELKKYSVKPFIVSAGESKKTSYYLVANKNSNIKLIKDLKNKTFSYYTVDKGYSIWLDYLIRKNLNTSLHEIIKKKNNVSKDKKLLLDVYFNKSDFTVVSKIIYDDMILLNPSIRKNLTIIEKSKPMFFFGLGLLHKDTSPELIDLFIKIFESGEFNKKFSEVYKLLNLYGIQKSSYEELKDLDDFYDEYKELKKSNK